MRILNREIEALRTDPRRIMAFAWAWILAWAVIRIFFAGAFPLSPDETNYWQWGRHLDWSYHDQAPMIGWAIGFFTWLFGNNEVAVRLPSILSLTLASGYMVFFARRFFGVRTALAVALLSQGVLEFNAGGLLATADGVQALGWSAAAYHTARAYEEDTWCQWLAAGFWLGFGLLSKYTMVIFAVSALGYGLATARHRWRLAGLKPWVAVVLGLAMFSPVIVWNVAHDWNSLRHVAHIGGANQGFSLHVKYLGEFLGSQLALLTPLVFVLILWAWWRALRGGEARRNWVVSYCVWTSLPMFGLFLVMSLQNRVYGNWPGAGFLTATVLAAAFFAPGARGVEERPRPRWWRATVVTAYALTLIALIQVATAVFPLPVSIDRTASELAGWRRLGARVHEIRGRMPDPDDTFLFGMRYQVASELAFYVPGQPETVSINKWARPNVYDYWVEDGGMVGMDAVGATRRVEYWPRLLPRIFERVEGPEELRIYRTLPLTGTKQYVRSFYIWRCFGFKGGLRWVPPEGDVRSSGAF
ncbi:MAG: glycosyltransferase family 39 protein [Desulfatibacillaceae bacterium]